MAYKTHILRILFIFTAIFSSFTHMIAADDGNPFIIVLDAGHGGKDPGAIGSAPGNQEKIINLNITKELGRLLTANCHDVKVIYTRSTDVFVELGKRADIANKAKADLFISIHTNALPKNSRKATGVQSYTLALKTASTNLQVEKAENAVIEVYENGQTKYNYSNPKSSESDIMFELMQDEHMKESVEFARLAQREMVSAGRNDMGVQQANLAVLRLTYMPSVLLEVGYISTPSEESFLMSSRGQATMAKSIYNAICKYKAKITGQQSRLEKITPSDTPAQEEVSVRPLANQPRPQETKPQDAVKPEPTATRPKPEQKPTPAAKPEQKPAQNKLEQKPAQNKPEQKPANTGNKPVFKVQILAGTADLKSSDKQFKGLKVEKIKEGNRYRYLYGSTTNYNEVIRLRKSILDKFPDAHIVAFKNGKPADVHDSMVEWQKNK